MTKITKDKMLSGTKSKVDRMWEGLPETKCSVGSIVQNGSAKIKLYSAVNKEIAYVPE